jgi:hypothetical protein
MLWLLLILYEYSQRTGYSSHISAQLHSLSVLIFLVMQPQVSTWSVDHFIQNLQFLFYIHDIVLIMMIEKNM